MYKVEFPNSGENISMNPHVTYINLVDSPVLNRTEVVNITTRFNETDFAAAGIDPAVRSNFSTVSNANKRVWAYQDAMHARFPRAAYILSVSTETRPDLVTAGLASFALPEGTRARLLHPRIRQYIGWFDKRKLPHGIDTDKFATAALLVGLQVGYNAGLRRINILVGEELPNKDPNLMVVEHSADIKRLRFRYVGSDMVDIEHREYEGQIWTRRLTSYDR